MYLSLNLSNYQRSVLALELESVFSERAKQLMLSGNPVPKSEQGRTIETRKEVAKVANVSHETNRTLRNVTRKTDSF